ncbi:MAG: L,D-transpeptidase family protein [Pseudolabrys sp.]
MKSARFDRLLASTALVLVLALSSQVGAAQQTENPTTASVPVPDTTLPAPLTAKDIEAPAKQVAPGPTKEEPKQNATTAPTEPTKAATNAAPADAIGEKLRELITGRQFDRLVSRKSDRAGIEAYYSSHNYAPIWISNNAGSDRAKAAIAYLGLADAVGLDPNDYPTPDFKSATTADALAEAELKLTASALTFARHAQIGRIHFTRVSADIQYDLAAPEPADVLAKLGDSSDPGKVLDAYNPPQAEFKALRAKLADLRKGPAPAETKTAQKPELPRVHVPDGKILRPGMKDPRVTAVRKRLDIAGDKENQLYDDAVRDAVKTFQTENDINVDGNLGPNTVRTLNGERTEVRQTAADPTDTIIVNMERWRWVPRDLGNPHVVVNVPDYTLWLYNNDKVYWHTKIVVGKPNLVTPMVSAEMKFITVNPTWNVPPSIIEKEYLPALEADPQALDRIGLKLTQDADGTIHISQPPGAGNALGRIRFNFPNKFLVYQHDTPDKHLFSRDRRAFSHGCMRVQNPLTYGEKLLSLVLPKERYTEARLESMFGGSESNINFPKFIPVHLTYQTAFVDDAGKLQLREDIYGRDAKMLSILKSNERKVADLAVERAPNTSSKPVRMPAGMYGGGYSNGGGNNFFDWIFGGQQGGPRPYPPRSVPPPPPRNNGRYSWR